MHFIFRQLARVQRQITQECGRFYVKLVNTYRCFASVRPTVRPLKSGIGRYILFIALLTSFVFIPAVLANAKPSEPKTLRLASSDVSTFGSEYNTEVGYFNEVVRAVFEQQGINVKIEYFPYIRSLRMLQNEQVQAAYPIRRFYHEQTDLLYSAPLPSSSVSLLALQSVDLLDDSTNHVVGVIKGEVLPPEILSDENFKITHAYNHLSLLKMLELKRVDAILIDRYSASELLVREAPSLIGKVKFDNRFTFNSPYYFTVRKDTPNAKAIISNFNQALLDLQKSGAIKQILTRYGVYNTPSRSSKTPQLVIAAPRINNIEYAKYLARQFESRHPNVNIIWRVFEENVLRRRLLSNFALSENEFDVVLVGPFELKNWINYHWFESLDSIEPHLQLNDYFPPVRDAVSSRSNMQNASNPKNKEKLFGVPFTGETTVLYYRKDILKKHNISLPSPLTYSKLMAILKKVHQPEQGTVGIGLRTRPGWGQNMALISLLVNTFGGGWFDQNNQINVQTNEWKTAVKFYIQMLQRFGPNNLEDLGWQENQAKFAKGELVFFIDASSIAPALFDNNHSTVANSIAIADVPYMKTHQGSRWFWSWNFAVPNSSLNKDLAKQFVRFLSKAPSINDNQRFVLPSGVRRSSYQENGHMANFPYAPLEFQLLNNTPPAKFESTIGTQYAETFYFPTIGYHTGYEIHRALLGEIPVEEALENAQQKIDKLLQKLPTPVLQPLSR